MECTTVIVMRASLLLYAILTLCLASVFAEETKADEPGYPIPKETLFCSVCNDWTGTWVPNYMKEYHSLSMTSYVIQNYICLQMQIDWSRELCSSYVIYYLPTIYNDLSRGMSVSEACTNAGCTPN